MIPRKCDLLTLKRPTRVDEMIESVPKPRNAVPKHGLPLWKHLPLDAKLPVLHGPKREMVFTRDKIGRKLWQKSNENEFVLSEPKSKIEYDSLHDQHLRPFFKNKINRQRMFERGLITKEGDAICNLKDYNTYRRYLKSVHEVDINAERVKMEERGMERFLLRKAKEDEERDLMMHARKRIRKAKMKHVYQMQAEERQAKEDKLKERTRRNAERLEALAERKAEDLRQRSEKAYAFKMKIMQRNQQAEEIERKRKINALKKWRDSELARRKRMLMEQCRKTAEKEWKDYHHLDLKISSQLYRIDRQKLLLDSYQREMAMRAELRSKNVEYQRLQTEDRLMKIKAEKVRETSEHFWNIKAMVKALCKAWEHKLKHKTPEEAKEERCLIEKTIQLQMAEYKHKSEGKEVLAILQGAKRKLERMSGVPEPVTFALDCVLNDSILGYVKKKIDAIIADTVNQAEQVQKQLQAAMRELQRKKMLDGHPHRGSSANSVAKVTSSSSNVKATQQRTSICPYVDMIEQTSPSPSSSEIVRGTKTQSLMSAMMRSRTTRSSTFNSNSSIGRSQRAVSFGTIVTIDKVTEEGGKGVVQIQEPIPEDMVQVKRTKERPPTPVPSISQLVDAAFQDPGTAESLREADAEKDRLDLQLSDFSKKLVKLVLKKADLKLDTKSKLLYRQLSNKEVDSDLMTTRISEAILYEENPELMELPEVDHISNVLAKELIVKRSGYIFLRPALTTVAERPGRLSQSKKANKVMQNN